MALNYNELDSLTRTHFRKPAIDQVKNSDPLLERVLDEKKTFSGTKTIVPIKYDFLNTGAYSPFTGSNTFDTAIKEIHTAAEFATKGVYASLTIDGFTDSQNKGAEQVINMMEEKVKDLTTSLKNKMISNLLAGVSATGEFDGIDAAYAVTGTYGGIDRATNAFWQPKISANGGTARALTLKLLNQMYTQVTRGGQDAKGLVIVVGYDVYNKIWDLVEEKYRKVDTEKVGKIGVQAIIFNGVPILVSPFVSDSNIRFVNTDYFYANLLAGRDFHFTPFKPAQGNDTMVKQLLVAGNYVCDKLNAQGVIKDINAAL